MKVPIALLLALVIAVTLALAAPAGAQGTPASVDAQFRRLDANGDGVLDATEAGTLGFFRPADTDGDGLVTRDEAQAFARRSSPPVAAGRTVGMEGDGAAAVFHWPVPPVTIPEAECPVRAIEAEAADGRPVRAWWRRPQGDGAVPVIVFIHGGLTEFPEAALRQHLTANPVITRLVAAGYAVVMATFRSYEDDVQSRGPVEDVRAVVRATARLPGVDPRRIALYGGSGGGSIALELGGDAEVRAIVAGEPATVLYTGMLTTGDYGPRLEMMASPERFFTPELRERTKAKLATLRAPVLILHGDQHDLRLLNKPIIVPLMQEAGVRVEYREYPGYGHGFYFGGGADRWGKGADERVVADVVQDVRGFLDREMPVAVLGIPAVAFAEAPALTHGPFRVEIADDRTLRDAARGKDVPYRVSYPQDDGHYPLIVFSHGFGGSKDGFATVSRHWASHGYVVIQPTHADGLGRRDGDGNAGGPTRGRLRAGGLVAGLNDPDRIADRVSDLVLILDSLAEVMKATPGLEGRIDAKRIGVGGHSFGAYTAMLIGGVTVDVGGVKDRSFRDQRVTCILPISAQGTGQQGLTRASWAGLTIPMMTMTGTRDQGAGGQGVEWKTEPYTFSPPGSKYLVVIDGANHFSFGGGLGARSSDVTDVVKLTSTLFWDAFLKDSQTARDYLQSDHLLEDAGGSFTLESK